MTEYIDLGGKKRPILFGMWVFRKMKEECGKSAIDLFNEVQGGDFTGLPDAIYYALRAGETSAGITNVDDYTADKISIWLDESGTGLIRFVQLIAEAIQRQAAVEDNGKKSKAAKRPSGTLSN